MKIKRFSNIISKKTDERDKNMKQSRKTLIGATSTGGAVLGALVSPIPTTIGAGIGAYKHKSAKGGIKGALIGTGASVIGGGLMGAGIGAYTGRKMRKLLKEDGEKLAKDYDNTSSKEEKKKILQKFNKSVITSKDGNLIVSHNGQKIDDAFPFPRKKDKK